ncbi:DUF6680 family protein [Pectobacterium polaris]|uniref:DUF6680 family protein n=1 Tax=Pectobacterium polaris TaxID=2042057 RepID=UPI001F1D9C68|nr:DUF6680 family protein [Pectobacterium polaris]
MIEWLTGMTSGDCLVAFCTALSPLIAVQITKYIERETNVKNEKIKIFKTLMSTRSDKLDRRHVEALNSIDVVFTAINNGEKKIRSDWKAYLDNLNSVPVCNDSELSQARVEEWSHRRDDIFLTMMCSMGTYLGFDVDKTHIKNQSYFPIGYSDSSKKQAAAEEAILDILSGKKSLPVEVKMTPIPLSSDTDKAK